MSSRDSSLGRLLTACAASFAAGAALGAAALRWWSAAAEQQQQQQQPQPQQAAIDLASLPAGQLPGMPSTGGLPSPTGSVAGSVASFSLPPTPRFSATGSSSANGRTLEQQLSLGRRSSSGSAVAGGGDAGLRMVFVVRRDVAWSRQKLAVMVAHACLALFKKLYKARNPSLQQWELARGPKLVLKAEDEAGLLGVIEAARSAGLPHHSIAEAVAGDSAGGAPPRRSRTILAVGPLIPEQLGSLSEGRGLVLL